MGPQCSLWASAIQRARGLDLDQENMGALTYNWVHQVSSLQAHIPPSFPIVAMHLFLSLHGSGKRTEEKVLPLPLVMWSFGDKWHLKLCYAKGEGKHSDSRTSRKLLRSRPVLKQSHVGLHRRHKEPWVILPSQKIPKRKWANQGLCLILQS